MKAMQAVEDAGREHARLSSSSALIARAQGLIRSGLASVRKLEQDPQVKGVFGHVPQLVHNKGMQVCPAATWVACAAGWGRYALVGWKVAQAKENGVL